MKQSTQNYLKAMVALCGPESFRRLKINEISKKLEISPAAVNDMVKKLEVEKFVTCLPYKGVTLTKKGWEIGCNMIRHHRLWESFLYTELGLSWDKVHEEAERLEHACSDEIINKIEEKLGFPKEDPHGNPIPDRNGKILYKTKYTPPI
ncbi:MAG: metal-dependent transcriptional regulator [Candidatus Margulisbacteria bacterium]|nr:metal-dependent transcriptional regulator [Candidatus Margulisiibacteriota bacterium]